MKQALRIYIAKKYSTKSDVYKPVDWIVLQLLYLKNIALSESRIWQ